MSAYVIASYDIVDPERYAGYPPAVIPLLGKHRAEVLVADYAAEALEGEKRAVYVVLRFDSEAAARAWYEDPEYAAPKEIRLSSSTNANLVLAKEFSLPGGG